MKWEAIISALIFGVVCYSVGYQSGYSQGKLSAIEKYLINEQKESNS